MTKNNDYVFTNINGEIRLKGDFDGLYRNVDDPWGQSALERTEYNISRKRQIDIILSYKSDSELLDIGCGLGFTTAMFSKVSKSSGADISQEAISRARNRYPGIEFNCLDIRRSALAKCFDVVVLNQVLWYVIDEFTEVLSNCIKMMNPGGILIMSNFLLPKEKQMFAKQFFDGPNQILVWLERVCSAKNIGIEEFHCYRVNDNLFDFHLVLRATN